MESDEDPIVKFQTDRPASRATPIDLEGEVIYVQEVGESSGMREVGFD